MKKRFITVISTLFFVAGFLFSCSNEIDNKSTQVLQALLLSQSDSNYGSLTVSGDSSRALDNTEITHAIVTVSGYDSSGNKFTKTSGIVEVLNGSASGVSVTQIPVCKNAVVSVQGYSDSTTSTEVKGAYVTALVEIKSGSNSVNVTRETSKTACVYKALFDAGVNTNTLTETQLSSINNAIPSDVDSCLIKATSIASAFKSNSLAAADTYKLTTGSVTVTANQYNGYTFQITDPLSASSTLPSTVGGTKILSGVAPGTWKLIVWNGTSKVITKSVTVTSDESTSVTVGSATFDGIQIQVAKSLNYPLIHYWSCSNATTYPNTTWPGTAMLTDWCDDDYIYNFEGCSSVNILITNSSESKLYGTDIKITEKGSYRITASGLSASTYISDTPPEPVTPSVSISPSSGEISLSSSISVTFDAGNDTITSATVTINGTSYDMGTSATTWSKSLSDLGITSAGTSITVSASVTNSVGTGSASAILTSKEGGGLVENFNQLTMFQVMVSHFQDGDSSIGYTNAYGPTGQTYGGDLQGIINSLDYLEDLGINALWMTPIFNSNSSSSGDQMGSTGYYTYDYFDIDPRFGTKAKFVELVEECHSRGINVILDGVFGHWGSAVKASPNGKTPSRSNGQYKGCNYPASLDFFKEVAEYWIKEYKIDGWRLDQAYQAGARSEADGVYTGETNYWPQLRATVESAAASNGTKGTDWGTLGYMVGEVLDGNQTNIQNWVVVNDGLQSNFDFPSRYKLCNAILGGSDWANSAGSDTYVDAMTYTYNSYTNKGYTHSSGYYPNLFFSNHDLLRFGDLIINWKSCSYGSDTYVGKYKVALASMASYTGPITLYMGDEWGEATQGISLIQNLSTQVGKGAYWDNSSRTSGRIDKATNGTAAEKEVLAYTKKLLSLRKSHEALWNGSSSVQSTSSSDLFVTKKVAGNETIYVGINNGTSSKTFSASGTDLISGTTYSGTVTVPALSAVYILAQ